MGAAHPEVEMRARQSLGSSERAIYEMVARTLTECDVKEGVLIDVGCGSGNLRAFVEPFVSKYVGIDVIRYDDFPDGVDFHRVNLDTGRTDLPNACADVVASAETIEHLENPRAFMREIVRLVKPGGLVIVTTPNQLSCLSLLSLIFKRHFAAFGDASYPAHLTALLEIDLQRIASECGLKDLQFRYSLKGRIVLTPWRYPKFLSRLFPRFCSDNLLLLGRRADG